MPECVRDDGGDDPNPNATPESSDPEPRIWSYEGNTGPANGAGLSDDYAACDGSRQSLIDLTDASAPSGETTLKTSYTTESGSVVDTGHAIQGNAEAGTLTWGGPPTTCCSFIPHAPSEHAVDGDDYPGDQQLAVLRLLVEEGSEAHPALDGWVQGRDTTISGNPGRLLCNRQSYYTYTRSLTTPPCSEIVR